MSTQPHEDPLLWDSEKTCRWLRSVGLGKFQFPVQAERLRMQDLMRDFFANPKRQKQFGIQSFHVKKFERAVQELMANKMEDQVSAFARPEDPVVNVPTILQSEHIGETFHIENPSAGGGLSQSEGQSRSKIHKKDPSQSLTHHQPVQTNTTSLNRAYGTAEINVDQINAQMHGINITPQQQQFNFQHQMSISPVNMASPRMVQPPPQNTQQFVNQHTSQANSNLPQLIQESSNQMIKLQQQMA